MNRKSNWFFKIKKNEYALSWKGDCYALSKGNEYSNKLNYSTIEQIQIVKKVLFLLIFMILYSKLLKQLFN